MRPRLRLRPLVLLGILVLPLVLAAADVAAQPPEGAPLSLSDADGQQLTLERLDVRTAVHGALALTEMEMVFRNPHGRRMEGRFTAVLPEDASVSRFAKEVNGRLVEAEVVERLRANQVYDQILQQMRDPALLEQDQGNRFSARIFPIEAGATVRVVLGYSQLLRSRGGERAYVVPLRGLSRVGLFTYRGTFHALPGEAPGPYLLASSRPGPYPGARVIERSDEAFTPAEDLEVRWRAEPSSQAAGRVLSSGGFYVASFRPRPAAPAPPSSAGRLWVFYLGTSASAAEGAEHRVRALERLLAALPAGALVELRAFDQRVVPLGRGTAEAMARRVGPLLRERLFLGGTDLDAMARDLAARAAAQPGARFVVVTDGVATLGRSEGADLLAAVSRIPARATVHALVLGARQDAATLRLLTRGRGRVVSVPFSEALDGNAAEAARRLALPAGASYTLADPGAEWVLSGSLEDVQPGDEVLAVGRLRAGSEPAPRLVASDGSVLEAAPSRALSLADAAPLLRREAYRAFLAELAERERAATTDSTRRALAEEQVRVSVEERVMIPRTTMLVLETEEDYRRFGLDRRALAGIVTVGPEGITLLPRDGVVPARAGNAEKVAADAAEALSVAEPGEPAREEERARGERENTAAPAPSPAAGSAPPQPSPVQAPEPVPTAPVPAPEPVAPAPVAEQVQARAPGVVVSPRPTRPGTAERARQSASTPPSPEMPDWVSPPAVTRAYADSLAAELRADPRRRDRYNLLTEALWALGDWSALRRTALAWQPYDPENPQVYEALGEAALKLGRTEEARRAFASLVEVAPARPELLQRAGLLLLRAGAAELAIPPLRRSLAQRPDRVNGYRHLALVLWRTGREAEAAEVLEQATRQSFPAWYGDVKRVVREELGYVYRAMIAKEPARRREIEGQAAEMGVDLSRRDALRVTLAWETDANDVDLHVVDPAGEESYYAHRTTKQGLELYEDITRGFGPEVTRADRVVRGTYHVGVNYFSAGPMGVSRGIVVVMLPDARGLVRDVQVHPFRLVEDGRRDLRLLAKVEVK